MSPSNNLAPTDKSQSNCRVPYIIPSAATVSTGIRHLTTPPCSDKNTSRSSPSPQRKTHAITSPPNTTPCLIVTDIINTTLKLLQTPPYGYPTSSPQTKSPTPPSILAQPACLNIISPFSTVTESVYSIPTTSIHPGTAHLLESNAAKRYMILLKVSSICSLKSGRIPASTQSREKVTRLL